VNGLANPTATEATGGADAPAPAQRKYARAREWTRLIAVTGAAQIAVQAIGFACGILVIRLLPTQEYALYTLANTMLGTMTLLADGGIAAGVMSQGGKVWNDRTKLGAVLVTGMALRKKFAVFSLIVATPILFYLLTHHGASWLTATLIVLSLIPAFFSALSGTLLEIVPKLRQDIAPLQRIQVGANAVRLALSGLFVFAFPFAGVAILASGAAQVVANVRLRKLSSKAADRTRPENREVRSEILRVVRRNFPNAAFYCLSGQLSLWILSLYGSTADVANLGALSRLTMLLGVLATIASITIVPRFARLRSDSSHVLSRFLQSLGLASLILMGIAAIVWRHPTFALWILGNRYQGLSAEMTLLAASSATSVLAGFCYTLGASRGIICPPWVIIGLTLVSQFSLAARLDLGTLTGVILFGWGVVSVGLLVHFVYITAHLAGSSPAASEKAAT
jgi:O-antigen/teichoic acid export membrane protein